MANERADYLVNDRSPRYLHGFQKYTNESTELPHTVPVDNQVTYIDSFTNYGVDTVYGNEYVISASGGNDPRIQDAFNQATNNTITTHKYHGIYWDKHTSSYETTISYDLATRTFSISPTSSSFRIYIDGVIKVFHGTKTITHDALPGGWFFYYDNTGVLTASQTIWDILTDIPVAFLYYDPVTPDYILLEERHHHEADKEWHNSQHFALGTFVKNGTDFVLGNYTIGVSSNAAVTWSLGSGTVVDEDIETPVSAIADGGPYQTWRKDGASGAWRRTQRTIPYHFNTGTNWIQYNQLTGGSWRLTDLSNNQFVCYYLFAVPATETSKQIIVIPGQRAYATETLADSEGLSDLDLTGFPSEEFVGVWKLVMRADTGGGATGRAQIRKINRLIGARSASSVGGTSPTVHNSLSGRADADTHPASSITNTPVAPITSVNVQGALNEVASLANSASSAAASAQSTANSAASAAAYAEALARSSYNLIKNGNSEETSPAGPEALLVSYARAYTGTKARNYTAASAGTTIEHRVSGLISCAPGDQFYMEAMVYQVAASVARIAMLFLGDDKTTRIDSPASAYTSTVDTWHKHTVSGTAPANAAFVVFIIQAVNQAIGTTTSWDCLYATRKISAEVIESDAIQSTTSDFSVKSTTPSTSTTTGAVVVAGGVATGDFFTGKHRSSDGSAGLTATRTFYAASSSGGATNVLNTVTIKDGIITSWTQA